MISRLGQALAWAIAGLLFSSVAICGGTAAAASVQVLADQAFFGLAPAPDGTLWALSGDPSGTSVVRIDENGVLTRAPGPEGRWLWSGAWHPLVLPDGTVGMFLRSGWGDATQPQALIRFDAASGAVSSVTDLPAPAQTASGLTVAPDGAIWFARSCEDEIGRIAPGTERISYVRLPRVGCGRSRAARRELGAGLAFDVRGALWLVNLCMGRIDRVSLTGRVREWRAPLISCPPPGSFDLPLPVPATIELDPNGGIAYANRAMGAGSSRVRDGHRQRFPSYGAGVFTADGALWRLVPDGIERTAVDGTVSRYPEPSGSTPLTELAPTRTDGVAVVRASYWRSYGGDSHNAPTPVYLAPRLVVIAPDGSETSTPLPDGDTDASWQVSTAALVLAPDGSFLMSEGLVGVNGFTYSSHLLRITADASAPDRMPVASVRGTLGRVGRTLWLQLSCDADVARFCVGTATLAVAGMAHGVARFAIPGQQRKAVPVHIGAAAVRALRRTGRLNALAVVASNGAPTSRRALVLRR
jgi:hypothetical protein